MPDNIPPIETADDHIAAFEVVEALAAEARDPEVAARLALLRMGLRRFEAKVHEKLLEDLTELSCWLHARHRCWRGGFHTKAAPSPNPNYLAQLSVWEEADEVRPQIWHDLLRALAALGYTPDGPMPARNWPTVQPRPLEALSAHRRIEAVTRIEAALRTQGLSGRSHSPNCGPDLQSLRAVRPSCSLDDDHQGCFARSDCRQATPLRAARPRRARTCTARPAIRKIAVRAAHRGKRRRVSKRGGASVGSTSSPPCRTPLSSSVLTR